MNLAGEMQILLTELFPLNRSLTGNGNRETLKILKKVAPQMSILEVKSGTKCFDWEVPLEWKVNKASVLDANGRKIVDYSVNNLHLVGYSSPFSGTMPLNKLKEHLFSLPEEPEAIPYRTTYYNSNWGFCIKHKDLVSLQDGDYQVTVDTELFPGTMTYGEIFLQGQSNEEILFSTYICHPSMASNELSGPIIASFLSKFLSSNPDHYYSYRFLFLPETIGSIFYLSKNLAEMQTNIIAGYVLTCLGDNRKWSYIPSRRGDTFADKLAKYVLKKQELHFDHFTFLDRGSDERQYCAPGVNLPICSVMRSKYGTFREYHNSLDNLDLVTGEHLTEGYIFYKTLIEVAEMNVVPRATMLGEPMMSKRKLRDVITDNRKLNTESKNIMDILAYSDGKNDSINLSEILNLKIEVVDGIIQMLKSNGLLEVVNRRV